MKIVKGLHWMVLAVVLFFAVQAQAKDSKNHSKYEPKQPTKIEKHDRDDKCDSKQTAKPEKDYRNERCDDRDRDCDKECSNPKRANDCNSKPQCDNGACCELYPIALSAKSLEGAVFGTSINVFNGSGPGNFGWLTWTGKKDAKTLAQSLKRPGNSDTYINPDNCQDHEVSVGDWINSTPGVKNSSQIRNALNCLLNKPIVLPVWDITRGKGSCVDYHVTAFAEVMLFSYQLPHKNTITATFLSYVDCGGETNNQPPVAESQTVTLDEDSSVEIVLNATDPDNDPLTFTIITQPEHGTLTGAAPTLTYQPNPDFHGSDSFVFTVSDGEYTSDPVTQVITINSVNDAPVVNAGEDILIDVTGTGTLQGTATDDGTPGAGLTTLWNHVRGPGTATFANASSLNTTVTFDIGGTYILRLTANDSELSSSGDIQVTVNAAPIVNAGTDLTTIDNQSLNINGTVTDDGVPGTLDIVWTKLAGPGTVLFGSPASADTTAVFSKPGSYVLMLSASDRRLLAADTVSILVESSVPNQAPAVNAGTDMTLGHADQITLEGTVADDSLPVGGVISSEWTQLSGPEAVTFADPQSLNSAVTFPANGVYEFQLSVTDGEYTNSDSVSMTVYIDNLPPVVSAGDDITLAGTQVTLNGQVSDDGMPTNATLQTGWTKISGPGEVFLSDATAAATEARFSQAGTYVLRLTANDGEFAVSDEVAIDISGNQPPIVNAGPDKTVGIETASTQPVPDPVIPEVNEQWLYDIGVPGLSGIPSGSSFISVNYHSLAWDDQNMYAAGWFNYINDVELQGLGMWDGCTWSPLVDDNVGFIRRDATVGPVAYGLDNLFVGGGFLKDLSSDGFADSTARWDGSSWQAWQFHVTSSSVSINEIYTTTNAAYVAGYFQFQPINIGGSRTPIPGYPISHSVARWTTNGWENFGDGLIYSFDYYGQIREYPAQIKAVEPIQAGTNVIIYAGGGKINSSSGDGTYANLARWEGTNWITIGQELKNGRYDGYINDVLLIDETSMYVCGSFTTVGSLAIKNIAYVHYDETTAQWIWSSLGAGLNNEAYAMTMRNGKLFVCGTFTSPGPYIAVWDGTSWSGIGDPAGTVNYRVSSILGADENFYAGGFFVTAGGQPSVGIARRGTPRLPVIAPPEPVTVYGSPAEVTISPFVTSSCCKPLTVVFNVDGGDAEYTTILTNTPASENVDFTYTYEAGSHLVAITAYVMESLPVTYYTRVTVLDPAIVTLDGSITDDGLPSGTTAVQWTLVDGPASASITDSTAPVTAAGLNMPGTYTLRLTGTDTELSAIDEMIVNVYATGPGNQAPTVSAGADQTIPLYKKANLTGQFADDGLPAGSVLNSQWTQVDGPGVATFTDSASAVTSVSFDEPGTYTLRLTVTDTELTSSDDVVITVENIINNPPVVNAGPDKNASVNSPTDLSAATVTDDGLAYGILTTSWEQTEGPGRTFFRYRDGLWSASFSTNGTYVLRLSANDGTQTSYDDVTVTVYPETETPGVVITSPADAGVITGPAEFRGTVTSDLLDHYSLEYRRIKPDQSVDEGWQTVSTGTGQVIDGVLGEFDPTLLLNGQYETRLKAVDLLGREEVSETITVLVDGNMKVGNFTVSFKDLSVPLTGIPIEVIRTYDSRDKEVGDFGVGWNMSLADIRVQKNRPMGLKWKQKLTGLTHYGGLPMYEMTPDRERIVTLTFPDGEVFRFRSKFKPETQTGLPIYAGEVLFEPMPGTHGTLELAEPKTLQCSGQLAVYDPFGSSTIDESTVDILDLSTVQPFDPKRFKFTTQEGLSFIIDEDKGVEKVIDSNGNEVQYTAGGIFHSNGQSVQFLRDSEGRVTEIVDPEGNSLYYTYNTDGDLQYFTDREENVTQFIYEGNHQLKDIIDPRGIRAVRCEYDFKGRLLSQTDAYGNSINMDHDIPNRRETVTDRLGNMTVHEYDSNGNVVKTIDALGGETLYTYDIWDNELSKTDPLGRTIYWTYDELDNQTSEEKPGGKITSTTYNSRRLPLATTDAMGNTRRFEYNPVSGNLTNMIDEAGNATTFEYNSLGLLKRMTDSLGNVSSYTYDGYGNKLSYTDPLGTKYTYTYDSNGNQLTESVIRTTDNGIQFVATTNVYNKANQLIETINPDGTSSEIEYNSTGQEIAKIDELGRRTEMIYGERNELLQTIYPDGGTVSIGYDAEGRKIAETNQVGYATYYYYDKLGRLTDTIHEDGSAETTVYDAAGRKIQTIDALGNGAFYSYPFACICGGHPNAITNAIGEVTKYTYDLNGNVTSMTDARNNTIQYKYDAQNRETKVIYHDGTFDETVYDVLGRVSAKIDQAGKATHYGYDALGRLAAVTNALDEVTRYEYDEVGNQLAQIDALGRRTEYGYDVRDNRVSRTLPVGQKEHSIYDAAGNLVERIDFNGRTTSFGYDVMNRLTRKTPDASFSEPDTEFSYDLRGLRTEMVDAHGPTEYQYDSRGRLTEKQSPVGALGYTYDLQGNLTAVASDALGGLNLTYGYDPLNRVTGATNPVRGVTGYSYDQAGNLASATTPNGVHHAYTYDSLNRLTNLQVRDVLAQTLREYSYTLAPTGRRTGVEELGGRSVAYQYDDAWRLKSETIAGLSAQYTGSILYTLDAVGNRLARNSSVIAVSSQSFSYDTNDRLTIDTYDENGNTVDAAVDGQSVSDEYDSENRLVKRVRADGSSVQIIYNGDGDRVAKTTTATDGTSRTVYYLVDRNNLTGYAQVVEEREEFSGQLLPTCINTYGLDLISQDRWDGSTWNVSYYSYDGHGNVRCLTDETGLITDAYDYDAFGVMLRQQVLNPISSALEDVTLANSYLTTPNNYLYCGEQYDPDLGMYFLRARYMQADRGRFWTMDGYEGNSFDPASLHKYTYANDDPVNGVDPSGTQVTLVEMNMTTVLINTVAAGLLYMTVKPAFETLAGTLISMISYYQDQYETWKRLYKTQALESQPTPAPPHKNIPPEIDPEDIKYLTKKGAIIRFIWKLLDALHSEWNGQ